VNGTRPIWLESWLYLSRHLGDLGAALASQIALVVYGSAAAIALGLFFGVIVSRNERSKALVLGAVGVLSTVPILALFGILITMTGIGTRPAVIALVIYGVLPILRNTAVGLEQVPKAEREAAIGMGASRVQLLFKVELPLAMPVIFAGVRVSIVMNFSIATYAVFVGGGGMGTIIMQGLRTYNDGKLFAGTIVVALATILLDRVIGSLEKAVDRRYGKRRAK
jgi:osmoprotectant transport system permease protein